MDKKSRVKRIFDNISKRYDFLNHFLSAGIDFYWRKKSLKLTEINKEASLLDVACGTGDFAIAANKMGVHKIFGADLSLNMLKLFNQKKNWSKGNIVQTVAEQMPFKNNSFTNITVGFGVRNFYDILTGFKSFFRILKIHGKVTILEFRLPTNFLIRKIYMFYFHTVLPKIGKIVSKDKEAYTYLPESVNEFDENINLPELLTKAGFSNIQTSSLTFGIVQVVIAEKL
jgi:demethylmenaquinone methyltransferase/2-methoxy-6-polyprenyl-1,4-benzoquinol methylase